MNSVSRSTLALLALGALAAPARGQIKLTGAGATFPNVIYQDWILRYNRRNPDVQLNYQSIGSGGGIRQFSDGTVDFGGSDAPMSDSAIAAIGGNVLHLPTVLGAVAIVYHLPGLSAPLRLAPDVVAEIFLGRVTSWTDPRIAAANPGLALPRGDVLVVHRSDGSGTTYVFTDYLSKVSTEWGRRVGRGTSVNWPVGLGGKGNEGVAAMVAQTPGSVGYVELAYAVQNRLSYAAVQNRAGRFVLPSPQSVTAAAASAMTAMGPGTDFRVSITDPPGAESYPIASFTWLLLRRTYPDPERAGALVRFVWWAVTEGQAAASRLGYAPLPSALRPWIEARLKTVQAAGRPVWPGPQPPGR